MGIKWDIGYKGKVVRYLLGGIVISGVIVVGVVIFELCVYVESIGYVYG